MSSVDSGMITVDWWTSIEELKLNDIFPPILCSTITHPFRLQLTKTIYSAIFKFTLKGHVVMSNEDSNAIKFALGKLPFIPAETPKC